MQQVFERASGDIYGAGYMIAHVPVLLPGETRTPTFYRMHGDVFGWGCVMFAVLRLLRICFVDRNGKRG